jgi:hypothetical protein
MGMHELSAVLWRERELLETLHFKLDMEHLLLTTGAHRWLGRASQEIEYVTARLKEVGLARAVEAAEVAESLGLDAMSTLRQLVAACEDLVWRDLLESHLEALLRVTAAIAEVRDGNERMLREAGRIAQDAAAGVGAGGDGTYDARGLARDRPSARLVDEKI